MWTDTPEARELIKALCAPIVAEVAPDELTHFDELIEEYFQNPTPPNLSDTPLVDFGLGPDITPAIAAAIGAALTYIWNNILKPVERDFKKGAQKKIRDLFKSKGKLTQEQLKQSRDIVFETLK